MPALFSGSIPAVLAATFLPFLASGAAAQPTAPDTPPPGQEQAAPVPQASPNDACTAQPGTGDQASATKDGESLTGKLANCNGVLSPPPMAGSDIQAPVPDADPGTTPVLPPGTVPAQPAQ